MFANRAKQQWSARLKQNEQSGVNYILGRKRRGSRMERAEERKKQQVEDAREEDEDQRGNSRCRN